MRKIFILSGLFLFISTLTLSGQSLKSIKDEIKDTYTLKFGNPIKIMETKKDYKSKREPKEEIIDFSLDGKTITTSRYNNGDLDMIRTRQYNENNLKTEDILKRKLGDKGWFIYKSTYYYEKKDFLKIITTMTTDYSKVCKNTTAFIQCDSLGEFTDCKLYDTDNVLIIHETGIYDYVKNIWTYSIYDPNEQLMRQEKLVINPTKKYNDKGDVIFYINNSSQEKYKLSFRVDYKYDKFGNWVEKNLYVLRKKENEILNERLSETVNRQIKY